MLKNLKLYVEFGGSTTEERAKLVGLFIVYISEVYKIEKLDLENNNTNEGVLAMNINFKNPYNIGYFTHTLHNFLKRYDVDAKIDRTSTLDRDNNYMLAIDLDN